MDWSCEKVLGKSRGWASAPLDTQVKLAVNCEASAGVKARQPNFKK